MVLERDASSVGALIPLLESEPTNVPQGMPSVFGLRKNAPTSVVPGLRAPILPVMFGTPGAFHAPAVSSTPSTQARKGRRLEHNQRKHYAIFKELPPFRNWVLGQSADAGAWGRDEIRNITGAIGKEIRDDTTNLGVFSKSKASSITGMTLVTSGSGTAAALSHSVSTFATSTMVPTGPQNVPQHIWQPVILYLGRPK